MTSKVRFVCVLDHTKLVIIYHMRHSLDNNVKVSIVRTLMTECHLKIIIGVLDADWYAITGTKQEIVNVEEIC